MTHPTDAVDLIARALWSRVNLPEPETGFLPFDVQAIAILDALAPLLVAPAVAAEREACAKVAEDRAAAYREGAKKLEAALGQKSAAVGTVRAVEAEGESIAAAIRERSRQ